MNAEVIACYWLRSGEKGGKAAVTKGGIDYFYCGPANTRERFKGWHLLYADQCPWHDKSAGMLKETAVEYGFDLKITKIKSAREAKQAPSGFGVFNLLHDGKLLEDHYISKARFRNIINKELNI